MLQRAVVHRSATLVLLSLACRGAPESAREFDASQAIRSILPVGPAGVVERIRQVGTTADRDQGRQHDTYVVHAAGETEAFAPRLLEAISAAAVVAGWRPRETLENTARAVPGPVRSHTVTLFTQGQRDGSIQVVWASEDAGLFHVIVDLSRTPKP